MSDITFETSGRAGIVTLTRPQALNALSQATCEALDEALVEWARDDRVERVAIRGEGKAFCAGGDIRAVYAERAGALDFFAAEYRADYRVATFPKPYVALMDGIAMGGGLGISAHGSHRVASENLILAMPEVAIGLFPDVGMAHVLARMPDRVGLWLAMSGERIGRDVAKALGVVTHPTEASRMGDALDRVAHAKNLDAAMGDLVVDTEPRDADEAAVIAAAFAEHSVEAVMEALAAAGHGAAARIAATIATRSPTSVALAFAHVTRSAGLEVAEVLRRDFRIVARVLDGNDLYEGIRAVVIDKGSVARWDPDRPEKVDPAGIAAHFEEPPGGDLDFGPRR